MQEIKGIRSGAKNTLGETAKNPLGKFVSYLDLRLSLDLLGGKSLTGH